MRIRSSLSDPLDFCLTCAPRSEKRAYERYGNLGDGPDGRGNCFVYDDEHPPYDDGYTCCKCGCELTESD